MTQSMREVFCVECEQFLVSPGKPLCPICLDEEMREVRERSLREAS